MAASSHYGVTIPGVLKLPPPAFGANAFDETIDGWNDFLGWNHIFSRIADRRDPHFLEL